MYALAIRLEEAKLEVTRFHSLEGTSDVNFVKRGSKNVPQDRQGKNVARPSLGHNQHSIFINEGYTIKCFRCGKNNHQDNQCQFRNNKCFSCRKFGHLADMCNSSSTAKSGLSLVAIGLRIKISLYIRWISLIQIWVHNMT